MDTKKFMEYSTHIQTKQGQNDIHGFKNYMVPECLPYAEYIIKFDKIATKYYLNALKTKELPLSAHAYVTLNKNGKILSIEGVSCNGNDESNGRRVDGNNSECKNTIDILHEIKFPRFTLNMKSEYLAFYTNIVNFEHYKNPNFVSGIKSSMPIEIKIKKRVWEYKTLGQIFDEYKLYLMLMLPTYR